MHNKRITLAFCTFNRAERLDKLVASIRQQSASLPFEILAINNNSSDNTLEELERLANLPGPHLRFVTEHVQGIVAARNRAIEESLNSDIMIFIDDDEIPLPGLIEAAANSIFNDAAECVGGRVELDFSTHPKPAWLTGDLLGFLAAIDYGNQSFQIKDETTPIWTANIAYDMKVFRDNPDLRFDHRYDRKGNVVGGGSDAAMFRSWLKQNRCIFYNPDMCVLHAVEPWRLKRSYFIKLHYRSGLRRALNELPVYPRTFLGIPPFMVKQLVKHSIQTVALVLGGKPGVLRQAMNVSHQLGMIVGYRKRKTLENITD